MKKHLLTILVIALMGTNGLAQITSPVTRANFGVDGDLRANFFAGAAQGSGDDWFRQAGAGTGQFIIDTTGAAAIVARYATDMAFRRQPFYRTMRYPGFSIVNNRMLLDAVFVRDYHGDDTTVFASGSNKNGDNPKDWSCPVSQGIPDKNDILDMMVHIRRAGPTATDSLWMFGGLSLDNTTGNRYFDFEMYQTDIYYDRGTRKFYGYGADDGHTSWQFDAAGNITRPGDIIFSAEYQSSSLTNVEARIWIHRSSLSLIPAAFNWTGVFDGAGNGAPYGYAIIQPKSTGTYYTGLQCPNNTWTGPFASILQDESVVTDYTAKQFVEFSVNLTKLGLDPVTLLGGTACGMPFRRVLVKTRASASFTAELKDFVGPFDLFMAPKVNILTETPIICNMGSIGEVHVTNPVATSTYVWYTPDGSIISSNTGTSIYIDRPGRYIVRQYLQAGCAEYAADTVDVAAFTLCDVLAGDFLDLKGVYDNGNAQLNWKVANNQLAQYFEIQRSYDGVNFFTIDKVYKDNKQSAAASYQYNDAGVSPGTGNIFYRIILLSSTNKPKYSNTIVIATADLRKNVVNLFPNPVKDNAQLQVSSLSNAKLRIDIFDAAGRAISSQTAIVQKGNNVLVLDGLAHQPNGIYVALIRIGEETYNKKIVVNH